MKNKVLFKVGSVSVDTQTLLTIAGVVAGIVAIKKFSEKKGTSVVKIETDGEAAANYENYVDEDFFGYVDEDFMGLHGGDESMKFGGGRPISFANAGGTDNAIYEPNFYNSDGSVPVATDEPNFANTDGMSAMPNVAAKRSIFGGRRKKKAADLDGSIVFGSARKLRKIKGKAIAGGVMAVPPPIQRKRKKGSQPVAMPPVSPAIIPKGRG